MKLLRIDGTLIHEGNFDNIRKLVEYCVRNGISLERADLRWADLEEANLRGADLRGADFRWADLRWTDLEEANLRGADLRWANLRGADFGGANFEGANLYRANFEGAKLRGANFRGADFFNTIGNGKEIVSMQLDTYNIAFTKDTLQIGCKRYSIEDWKKFSDEKIAEMNKEGALEWWNKWKDFIFRAIELSNKE